MTNLHDELTNALRRQDPPAGFADRVLSRVAEQAAVGQTIAEQTWGPPSGGPTRLAIGLQPDPKGVGQRLSFVHWAAAAALVAAVAGGLDYVAKQKERAEGEAAKERVVQALHIAGAKLQIVQARISQLHEE